MPRLAAILGVCVGLAAIFSASGSGAAVARADPADQVGVVATGDPTALSQLGVGWYLTFGFSGGAQGGMNRASVVRLTPFPDVDALVAAVKARPRGAWVIGNEPNVPTPSTSDALTPGEYGDDLNYLEHVIHQADPSAIIVGPNVLNWSDTCAGCPGYPQGSDWTQEFYSYYISAYGTRPPIDRWSIHTYELDWLNTPTLHTDFQTRQLANFRAWIDGTPDEAGRLIWDTEMGFHWAFAGWKSDANGKIVPTGSYDGDGVQSWLAYMLAWLPRDGVSLGVERSFLYAQAPPAEYFAETYGGLSLFNGDGAGAATTPAGKQLAAFLRPPASTPTVAGGGGH